jgi:hypothetical protein
MPARSLSPTDAALEAFRYEGVDPAELLRAAGLVVGSMIPGLGPCLGKAISSACTASNHQSEAALVVQLVPRCIERVGALELATADRVTTAALRRPAEGRRR